MQEQNRSSITNIGAEPRKGDRPDAGAAGGLLVGMAIRHLVQGLKGGVDLAPGEYVRWYVLPGGVDAALLRDAGGVRPDA